MRERERRDRGKGGKSGREEKRWREGGDVNLGGEETMKVVGWFGGRDELSLQARQHLGQDR